MIFSCFSEMNFWWLVCAALLQVAVSQLTNDPDKLRNWCLDSKHHKLEPGPEDELHSQCTPWKNRACCTKNTTHELHGGQMYNFNYHHCPDKPMSAKCFKHFTQDHCFFECEPNLGPWIVKVNMKTRKETFHGVPLCSVDCDAWFTDCKADYTCTTNWLTGFDWRNGVNVCRQPDQCKTIKEMYKNASHFCEEVWDQSWKYTDSRKPCMRLWFNPDDGNPNDQIAELRIAELLGSAPTLHYNAILLIVSVAISFVVSQ